MYDMTKIKTRYFEVVLPNSKRLLVEPPKIKALKKILSLSKSVDKGEDGLTKEDILDLVEGLALALSKNKQGYKVTIEFIENELNITQTIGLLTEYFKWVNEIQESKN